MSECVDQAGRKMCLFIRAKWSLKRFSHQRHRIIRGRIYVPIKCPVCFGPKCPGLVYKSYCWFYFKRNMRSGSFYTPVSRDSVFRRLVVKVWRTIRLIFFFLLIFHIAIVHSNITKPVLDIYEDKNSPK